MSFKINSIETAPEKAKPILEGAKAKLGFIPNLYGVMSESPELLIAYLTLSDLLGGTSFSPTELQTVLITASYVNNCDYCVAAHSVISSMQGVPADVVDSVRRNRAIADAKLDALRKFTFEVVEKRGFVSDDAKNSFLAAGYTEKNILEVILCVGMKTLSNYTNHVAETPLDAAFESAKWKKASA